jgi:hypothetical protein
MKLKGKRRRGRLRSRWERQVRKDEEEECGRKLAWLLDDSHKRENGKSRKNVGVFTAAIVQTMIFCIVTPYSLVSGDQCLGGTCCLHLQGHL